jgi:two-component system, NtrC family, response regulator GlrR
MKRVTIVLLDLCTRSVSTEGLSNILCNSFSDHKVEVRCVGSINDTEAKSIATGIAVNEPALALLHSGPSELKLAATLSRYLTSGANKVPVILVVEDVEPAALREFLKDGVSDFVAPPLRTIDIVPRVWRLLEQAKIDETPVAHAKEKIGLKRLIGESSAFSAEVRKFPTVARCDATVLLLGETGTGKELCARAIHYLSPRASKPFVPVNCGAIPSDLVENELFGHEKEAFTGAASSSTGLIREADGGTLFLDEIDCLPLLAQVKLLRFLQEKEYRPLGSARMRRADIRIMAATNANLEEAVSKGTMRRDLFYRLSVIPLSLPPLRERRGDILLLANHFLARYSNEFNKRLRGISEDLAQLMLDYEWPGNVRELEHVIQRAVVMCENEILGIDDISIPKPEVREPSFNESKAGMIARFERDYIDELLRTHQGNISKAARSIRKDPRVLRRLIRKHNIDVQSFRQP